MPRLPLPFEIPGYRIMRRLALGGMATVYLAIQESLARPVAVKVLAGERTPNDELARRFENEARMIARLDHPHIVSIHDVGRTSSGQIYYTMPYLPNGDLSGRSLRDSPERVLGIVRALAEALGFAHEHGIVHRDVKPENVLFDNLDRPLLADFGIALSGTQPTRVTREGATIGSSGYMSPEQARGGPIDGRSDLYSLGVLCYELLAGEMPFHGADALAVALAHIEKPVPRLPVTRRLWQPLIDKALAKHPEARFQGAEEFIAALDVIERRMRAPQRLGLRRWWLPLADRIAAVPRRQRALSFGLIIAAVLAGLVALMPRVPEPAAMPADAAMVAPEHTLATTVTAALPPLLATDESLPATAPAAAQTPLEEHLRQAANLIERGRLTRPESDNAAREYLAILAGEPQQRDALKGIRRLLDLLATRAAKAIDDGDSSAALDSIAQGQTLAERAHLAGSAGMSAFVAPIHNAIETRRKRVRDPFDTQAIAGLAPLLPALAKLDAEQARAVQADLDRPAQLLRTGGRFRDANGPSMVVLPARRSGATSTAHALAIGADETTRADYARFAAATGRVAARCRESQRLFARSDGLAWGSPGFMQGKDHPVVCVSWDDASAYAQWLSTRTGARYRLPTAQEWLLAAQAAGAGTGCRASNIGKHAHSSANCDDSFANTSPVGHFAATRDGVHDIAGNVGEWVAGCVKPAGATANCRERSYRGLSWRDDDGESNLLKVATSASDIGYATVGFRLVRELPVGDASR